MDKSIEAMKLALEVLEKNTKHLPADFDYHFDAITAIKEALAQTQEPVAWMWRCNPYCDWPNWEVSLKRPADSGCYGDKRTEGYEDVPLYTAPPQRTWVGLTDEEVRDLWSWSATSEAEKTANTQQHAFARAIEAKLKEKNT